MISGADPGVLNLVVVPAAARPAGDAIQFDVTDGWDALTRQKESDGHAP
jgi:hypothetical protein